MFIFHFHKTMCLHKRTIELSTSVTSKKSYLEVTESVQIFGRTYLCMPIMVKMAMNLPKKVYGNKRSYMNNKCETRQ